MYRTPNQKFFTRKFKAPRNKKNNWQVIVDNTGLNIILPFYDEIINRMIYLIQLNFPLRIIDALPLFFE